MAPQDRGPSRDDRTRMEAIRDAQRTPTGHRGHLLGGAGSEGRAMHVIIDDAADKFFDSFRAPNASQGPQRAGEHDNTGEGMFRATLTHQRVAAEVAKETANQLKTAASMAVQFAGDLGKYTAELKIHQDTERQRVSEALDRIERMFTAPGGGDPHPAPPRGPGGSGTGAGTPRATPSGSPRPAGPGRPARPDLGYENLATHRAHAQHGLGDIRRQFARQFGENVHQEYGAGTAYSNTVVPVRDRAGDVTHYEERAPGGAVLRSVHVSDPEAPSMARKAMTAFSISRMAGAIANGSGLGGVMRAGAAGAGSTMMGAKGVSGGIGLAARVGARAIPFVGAAVMAGDVALSGLRFAQDQRAKNMFYQGIQGGSNVAGFGDRLQEEGFTWSQLFHANMGSDQARQLFKGASSLGLQGQDRAHATEFGSQNYKQGIGVEQSLRAIQIASAGANIGLAGVGKALTQVTQAARSTGQSAEVLRDKFLDTMQAATAGGYGAGSADVASALTQAGPGRSRNQAGVDYSGMFNGSPEAMTAAQLGMNYGQYTAMKSRGDDIPILEAKDKQLNQSVVNTSLTPYAKRLLDQKIAENGGVEAVNKDPNLRKRIGDEVMSTPGVNIDPRGIRAKADQFGVQLGPDNTIGEWMVDRYTGGGSLAQVAKEEQAKQAQRKLGPGETTPNLGANTIDVLQGRGEDSKFVHDNKQSGFSLFMEHALGKLANGPADQAKSDAVSAYGDLQGKTHNVDPAIEAMITQMGDKTEVGIEVQTKDGKKVVSQADAIKYYSDQIASGEASVVGGVDSGKSLGETTRVKERNFAGDISTGKDAQGDTSTKEDWVKSHPGAEIGQSAGGGKVEIVLSDDAKRLFNIGTVSGNVTSPQVESGAKAGVPPAVSSGPR